jgi:hypothetical protein
MRKKSSLTDEKLDNSPCEAVQERETDIRQFMPSTEDFVRFFRSEGECCTLEELDTYAHGILKDETVKAQVESHLTHCKECSDFVALIREFSFKLNPEDSEFPALWEELKALEA